MSETDSGHYETATENGDDEDTDDDYDDDSDDESSHVHDDDTKELRPPETILGMEMPVARSSHDGMRVASQVPPEVNQELDQLGSSASQGSVDYWRDSRITSSPRQGIAAPLVYPPSEQMSPSRHPSNWPPEMKPHPAMTADIPSVTLPSSIEAARTSPCQHSDMGILLRTNVYSEMMLLQQQRRQHLRLQQQQLQRQYLQKNYQAHPIERFIQDCPTGTAPALAPTAGGGYNVAMVDPPDVPYRTSDAVDRPAMGLAHRPSSSFSPRGMTGDAGAPPMPPATSSDLHGRSMVVPATIAGGTFIIDGPSGRLFVGGNRHGPLSEERSLLEAQQRATDEEEQVLIAARRAYSPNSKTLGGFNLAALHQQHQQHRQLPWQRLLAVETASSRGNRMSLPVSGRGVVDDETTESTKAKQMRARRLQQERRRKRHIEQERLRLQEQPIERLEGERNRRAQFLEEGSPMAQYQATQTAELISTAGRKATTAACMAGSSAMTDQAESAPSPWTPLPESGGPERRKPGQKIRSIPTVLYTTLDAEYLSTYQCLVRKQLELFVSDQDDVRDTTNGRLPSIKLGQVGLRCRHCHACQGVGRLGATYFSQTIDGLYQIGQNLANNHLREKCDRIPPDLRRKLLDLRNDSRRAASGKLYWADRIRDLGVYEVDGNIRAKPMDPNDPIIKVEYEDEEDDAYGNDIKMVKTIKKYKREERIKRRTALLISGKTY